MRGLKVAVVVMGVLILAGLGVIIVTIVSRMRAGPVGGPAPQVALQEPAGTRIAGISVLADRLAVELQGGGPDRVVVVDTATGRVLARVGLAK